VPRTARTAKNDDLYREVNERIRGIGLGDGTDYLAFVCECSRIGCTDVVDATVDEYLLARASATRYIVLPGHVDPAVEQVVVSTMRYAIVEKPDRERTP
jgi:hypothetical protein